MNVTSFFVVNDFAQTLLPADGFAENLNKDYSRTNNPASQYLLSYKDSVSA